MAREDIYKMARALSRDTSPSSKRLPKYPPYQQIQLADIASLFCQKVDSMLSHRSTIIIHPLNDTRMYTPQLIRIYPYPNKLRSFHFKLKYHVCLTCMHLHRENHTFKKTIVSEILKVKMKKNRSTEVILAGCGAGLCSRCVLTLVRLLRSLTFGGLAPGLPAHSLSTLRPALTF